MIAAVQAVNWPAWIALVISSLALVGNLGNFLLTLWRGRRHVSVRSWIAVDEVDGDGGPLMYLCRVTNTGYVGVQIDRVELRSAGGSNVGVVLRLPEHEQPRKLDSGESQEWYILLDELGPGGSSEIPVTVVATDTVGKEHLSRPEDTVPVRG